MGKVRFFLFMKGQCPFKLPPVFVCEERSPPRAPPLYEWIGQVRKILQGTLGVSTSAEFFLPALISHTDKSRKSNLECLTC